MSLVLFDMVQLDPIEINSDQKIYKKSIYYIYRMKLLIKYVLAGPINPHFIQKRAYALEVDMFISVVSSTCL